MRALTKVLFWLAMGCWVGGIVAVSFLVAPVVFEVVPRATAGTVMGALFPLYYKLAVVAGVIALASALALWRASAGSGAWKAIVVMLAVMLAATTYAGAVVQPAAHALRPALQRDDVTPDVRARFARLHGRAMQLNVLVLVLGLATVGVAASSLRLPGE
jgi:hypothetical protein